jgi:hypothetical protein
MQINAIDFIINDSEKISVELTQPLSKMYVCDQTYIVLWKNNERCILSFDSLYENMYVFRTLLSQALDYDLYLHPSIDTDIGFLYNQYLQDKPGLTYEKLEGRNYWVGNNYLIFNYHLAVWLYNETLTGAIILHITPIYPGNFVLEEDGPFEISYDEWLKDYRPFYTAVISREIAEQWIKKVQNIVATILEN